MLKFKLQKKIQKWLNNNLCLEFKKETQILTLNNKQSISFLKTCKKIGYL